MVDVKLTCNFANCNKKLTKHACITSCSHMFCPDHSQDMQVGDNCYTCLACGSQLRSDLDFVRIDMNPNEQYKAMILCGLNPEQIMDIATRALSFYIYQLNYESQNKGSALRRIKEQIEELKHYCTSLTAKYKMDIQKQRRMVENIKVDLETKLKENEMQQQEIAQCKRTITKLQVQLESHKREIINMKAFSHLNSSQIKQNAQEAHIPPSQFHFGEHNYGMFGPAYPPAPFSSPFPTSLGRFST